MHISSRHIRLPHVTGTILLTIFAAYLLSYWLFPIASGCNECTAQGEWWRLLTSLFVHVTFSHMLSNMFSILLLGTYLEPQLGTARFLLLFLAAGVIGNIATYIFAPASFIHAGASGSVFGLLGSQLYAFYLHNQHYGKKEVYPLLIVLLLMVSVTFADQSVNVMAHLAGLIAGGMIAPLLFRK